MLYISIWNANYLEISFKVFYVTFFTTIPVEKNCIYVYTGFNSLVKALCARS